MAPDVPGAPTSKCRILNSFVSHWADLKLVRFDLKTLKCYVLNRPIARLAIVNPINDSLFSVSEITPNEQCVSEAWNPFSSLILLPH